jgi:transposase
MRVYLGLDVHSKMTVYCAQNQAGKIIGQGETPTSPAGLDRLLRAVAAPRGTLIALESGTQAVWVSRLLEARGMAPRVINAREVRAKARNPRQKTDRRDAFELCDGLRRGQWVSIVWAPSAPIERLRAILSRRRHFVAQATRQINAAKFLLRRQGLSRLYRSLQTEAAWSRLVAEPPVTDLRAHLELHHQVWRQVRAAVEALERELPQAAAPLRPVVELLETMPGVGLIVALTFIATLGDPERFADASRVVGYVGLGVSTYDSGERERHGHITKSGSPALRAVLCEAAHHAARPTHPLHPYFARVAARRGVKPAVIAVAQRMARILWQMWRTREPFDARKLNVEPVAKIKRRHVYWEIRQHAGAAA